MNHDTRGAQRTNQLSHAAFVTAPRHPALHTDAKASGNAAARSIFPSFFAGIAFLLGLQTSADSKEFIRPCCYQSRHFLLYTDLPPAAVEARLEQMEASLQFAAKCWGREPEGTIHCYLISDAERWPDKVLPNRLIRVVVGGIGGITVSRPTPDGKGIQAVIYASAAPHVIEHEIIHAYCMQTFGATGPEWYKEGMAEVASFGEHGLEGVQCPENRLAVLRADRPKPICDILRVGQNTHKVNDALERMLSSHRNASEQIPLGAWTERDSNSVQLLRDEYLWSWALCHFLLHNPNYADRFRMIGQGYVSRRRDKFEHVFEPMAHEMAFEFRRFVEDVEPGYRIDLCYWDWHKKFLTLKENQQVSVTCHAARGWQAAEVMTLAGATYQYDASGTWKVNESSAMSADGDEQQRGRLTGVILSDLRLGKPFPLGRQGQFTAPSTGKLYVRCQSPWGTIGTNQGATHVTFTRCAAVMPGE